jgi:hypothetical protein
MAGESMSKQFRGESIINGVEACVDHEQFFTIVSRLEDGDFEKISKDDLKWFLKLFEDGEAPMLGEEKESILSKAKQLVR